MITGTMTHVRTGQAAVLTLDGGLMAKEMASEASLCAAICDALDGRPPCRDDGDQQGQWPGQAPPPLPPGVLLSALDGAALPGEALIEVLRRAGAMSVAEARQRRGPVGSERTRARGRAAADSAAIHDVLLASETIRWMLVATAGLIATVSLGTGWNMTSSALAAVVSAVWLAIGASKVLLWWEARRLASAAGTAKKNDDGPAAGDRGDQASGSGGRAWVQTFLLDLSGEPSPDAVSLFGGLRSGVARCPSAQRQSVIFVMDAGGGGGGGLLAGSSPALALDAVIARLGPVPVPVPHAIGLAQHFADAVLGAEAWD